MNNFSIFKAKEKKNETSPDYNLSAKIGEEYVNIGACWIKDGKAGKFMSCKLSEPYMARAGFDIIELPAPMKANEVPKFDRDSQGKPLGEKVADEIKPEDIPW